MDWTSSCAFWALTRAKEEKTATRLAAVSMLILVIKTVKSWEKLAKGVESDGAKKLLGFYDRWL
jgi:hypothetical protein